MLMDTHQRGVHSDSQQKQELVEVGNRCGRDTHRCAKWLSDASNTSLLWMFKWKRNLDFCSLGPRCPLPPP